MLAKRRILFSFRQHIYKLPSIETSLVRFGYIDKKTKLCKQNHKSITLNYCFENVLAYNTT